MAVLKPINIQQFLDDLGNPIASGTVYFYTAGTSTPKNVYSDQSGTVLGTSVTLNSAGRPSSGGVEVNIWLSGSYKIIVKNSSGVQVGPTKDNVDAFPDVDLTGLTATAAQLNSVASSLGTAGTVVASKAVVVDSNKDIATFRNLTATNLIANTQVQTTKIVDTNQNEIIKGVTTASAVNEITVTPSATGNKPLVQASGDDTNITLDIKGKGTGGIRLSAPGAGVPLAINKNASTYDAQITHGTLTANRTVTLPDMDLSNFVVQRVSTISTGVNTGTTVMPRDDTIPQSTEGDQYMSLSITPKSTSNILVIRAIANVGHSTPAAVSMALFQDSSADALAAVGGRPGANNNLVALPLTHVMTAGTTSSTTFKIRIGPDAAATVTFNGTGGSRLYGGVCASSLEIIEYAA